MNPRFGGVLFKSLALHGLLGLGVSGIIGADPQKTDPRVEPMPIEIQESARQDPLGGSFAPPPSLSALPEVNREKVSPLETSSQVEPRETIRAKAILVKKRISLTHPASKKTKISFVNRIKPGKPHTAASSRVTESFIQTPIKTGHSASIPVIAPKPSGASISHSGRQAELGAEYLNGLIRLISSHRSYPRASVLLEEQGMVRVKMILDHSGTLVKSVLVASSGFSRLDQAALETLRKIGRFPVPDRFQGELSVLVPIEYRLTP